MGVTDIDKNLIRYFYFAYINAENIFGIDPVTASPEKQKEIRNWIESIYIEDENFPGEIKTLIEPEQSDSDVLQFFKACCEQAMQNETLKKQQFDHFSAALGEDVKKALWNLMETDIDRESIQQIENDVVIDVDSSYSYSRRLILHNASGIPKADVDCLYFGNGAFTEQNGVYCLSGETQNYEDESAVPFTICFSDATVENQIFRLDKKCFDDTPWQHLQTLACEMLDKADLFEETLNAREKEILPLMAEIEKMEDLVEIPEEYNNTNFPVLKSYIRQFGYDALLPLLESFEQNDQDDKKKSSAAKKLIAKLNMQSYEPLWRFIYQKIVDSQEGYPAKPAVWIDQAVLAQTRMEIQKQLERYGYTGTYPDFSKEGSLPGIHLEENYDQLYFVGMKKNVVYFIHCSEEFFDEHLTVEFLCGTAVLRKNETVEDVYACLFNAKGRRLFHQVTYESGYKTEEGDIASDDLEEQIAIAVKKTELKRLTRKEKDLYYDDPIPVLKTFLGILLFGGGLFAIILTAAVFLLCIVFVCLLGQWRSIPEMIAEIPWRLLVLIAWIGFGGAMGLFTVLAKRK